MRLLRVTEVLALAGATDYSWGTEDAKHRGSEVHRAIALASRGTLKRKSVPARLAGYVAAFEKFKQECRYVPMLVEDSVTSKTLGIRGRIDAYGYMRGKKTILDFKTGAAGPAVALQLSLYALMLHGPGWWGERVAVQLRENGRYGLKCWPAPTNIADEVTALAVLRFVKWKIAEGIIQVK